MREKKEYKDQINDDDWKRTVEQISWMRGIDTFTKFKNLLLSKTFWAENWAISTIEKELEIKIILLSRIDENLQCGEMNKYIPLVFKPKYYLILEYNGNHYQLVQYREKFNFQFSEIPEKIKLLIKNICLVNKSEDSLYYRIPEFKKYIESERVISATRETTEEDSDIKSSIENITYDEETMGKNIKFDKITNNWKDLLKKAVSKKSLLKDVNKKSQLNLDAIDTIRNTEITK